MGWVKNSCQHPVTLAFVIDASLFVYPISVSFCERASAAHNCAAPTPATRGTTRQKQGMTNRGGKNGSECNQKCGRENMHRGPNATQITRHAKNACGVNDKMTTNVAAVK